MKKLILMVFSALFTNEGFSCIEEKPDESYEFEEILISEINEETNVDKNLLNIEDFVSRSYKIKWVEDYISD